MSWVFPFNGRGWLEMKRCETPGCKNAASPQHDFCASCRQKMEQERLREEKVWHEYAEEGTEALERLLERYAEFEELYGPE